jgi:undecaprenyl-diphosphatase
MSAPAANKPNKYVHLKWRQLIIVFVLILVVYVVVPQLSYFRQSLELLKNVDIGWSVVAALLYLGTGLMSVGIYKALILRRLPFWRTVIVEYGSSFANRLVPAGVGALGVNYLYFRKQKCSVEQSLAAVTLNNTLGFFWHTAMILFVLLTIPRARTDLTFRVESSDSVLITVGGLIGLIVLWLLVRNFRTRILRLLSKTFSQILAYKKSPYRLAVASIFSVSITLLHVLCLAASAKALGVNVEIWQGILVLALGVGLGAAIPSPGGLGGAEAGLVAGLLAFDLTASSAIAVALLYRLVSYWLGFAVGAITFAMAQRSHYV